MTRRLSLILIIIFILLISVGCVNENDSTDESVVIENTDESKDSNNVLPNDTPITPSKKAVFSEAFPEDVINNPQAFMEQLIPGFRIGMSLELVKESIGEPKDINITQGPWGEESNLIYEDIQNYQIMLKIADNRVVNFEVSRYLDSAGIIPKLINKYTPKSEEPITYQELGFEGVTLGLRVNEVLYRLGDPLKGFLTYDEMYGYDLAMVYKGVTVHIILEMDNPNIQFIETNNYGNVSTYRGISVGSNIDEVFEIYGQPDYTLETSEFLIYSTDDYWYAIKFEIMDDKVKGISIYSAS
ncbi:MAG: hypothetical protein AB7V16_09470 [Vulcanibacillus sp.]